MAGGEKRGEIFMGHETRSEARAKQGAERVSLVARLDTLFCLAIHEDVGKSEASDEPCDK